MKKFFIFIGIFIGVLLISKFYIFTPENISNFVKKEFKKKTGNNISFENFNISYNNGIILNFKKLKIFNNKKSIVNVDKIFININFKKLFSKVLYINTLKIENGDINYNFEKYLKPKNNKNSQLKNRKSSKKFIKFYLKNINIKKLSLLSEISNEKVKLSILNLTLENFSLQSKFKFNLLCNLIVNKSKGKIFANGNIFLPESQINANLKADNLNLEFLKTFGLKISKCNIDGKISGNFKKSLFSYLNIYATNVNLSKYETVNFNNFAINLDFNFKDKNIFIKKGVISIDNKSIAIFAKANINNFKNYKLSLYTNNISSDYLKKFIPEKVPVKLSKNGNFKITKLLLAGSFSKINDIKSFFEISDFGVSFKEYNFSNISFNGEYSNEKLYLKNISLKVNNSEIKNFNLKYYKNILSGNGNIIANLSDLPQFEKELSFQKGILQLNLKTLYIPLKNFSKKKLKFSGNFFIKNGLISYDFFKNIKVKSFQGDFNEKVINLKKANVIFRNNNYLLSGNVKHFMVNPVTFDFDISSNIFDRFIADKLLKLDIGNCKNAQINVHLKGGINKKFKIALTKGKINFYNSNVKIYGLNFENIFGKVTLDNDTVNIKALKLKYNSGNYNINGKIYSPFKKQVLNLNIKTDKIDEFLTKKIGLGEIYNIDAAGNIKGNFKKIVLDSAYLKFKGTNLAFKKYRIKNITGSISYKKNVATIKNIFFKLNNIKYLINGNIYYPFENLSYSLNIKTNTIDKMLLHEAGLNLPTIHNVIANINISGNIKNKLTFKFNNSIIKFVNSKINNNFKSIKGNIVLKNNKITLDNIRGKALKGVFQLNGYIVNDTIKKGYFRISGRNFHINKIKNSKKSTNKKSKKNKKSKTKKPHFLKVLYKKIQNLNIQIVSNFENIFTESENFKKINFSLKVDKKGIFVKNCNLTNNKNGRFYIKKGELYFDKINKFVLHVVYNNINIGDIFDFLIPKKSFEFYGNADNCSIKLYSNFKKFTDFEKGLNGRFNINFKKGFINKVPMIANIFSILNIAQIFKFKLPNLSSDGFYYNSLKGDFKVHNGVISTKSLKLDSDSINLVYFGDINLVKKVYNAHLVVYPLKTVDTIIKHIPLIGYLFRDKKGSGTIVTYFRIRGPLDNPSISMQPAKTVTKKVESLLKNIIKLPFNIFTKPQEILIPNSK